MNGGTKFVLALYTYKLIQLMHFGLIQFNANFTNTWNICYKACLIV